MSGGIIFDAGKTKARLDSDAEIIEDATFAECYNLKTVVVGEKLRKIEDFAFYRCFELKSIDLTNTQLEYIGEKAFAYSGLESIFLPNGLKHIGEQAFYYSRLDAVEVPPSVESIGNRAFTSCKSVTLYNTYRPKGFYIFYDFGDIKYGTNYQDHIVTVKSAETREILYQLFIPGNEGDEYQKIIWYCWNDTVNFDFEAYDRYFLNLELESSKYRIAECRLKYPMMLKDKYRRLYEQYIKYSNSMKKNK